MLDIYAYPQAVNLAIAMPYNEKCFYWHRANEILLTKPVRFSNFLAGRTDNTKKQNFNSYVNKIYKNDNIILAGNTMKYIETRHSAFDEYLLEQEFHNFNDLFTPLSNF